MKIIKTKNKIKMNFIIKIKMNFNYKIKIQRLMNIKLFLINNKMPTIVILRNQQPSFINNKNE